MILCKPCKCMIQHQKTWQLWWCKCCSSCCCSQYSTCGYLCKTHTWWHLCWGIHKSGSAYCHPLDWKSWELGQACSERLFGFWKINELIECNSFLPYHWSTNYSKYCHYETFILQIWSLHKTISTNQQKCWSFNDCFFLFSCYIVLSNFHLECCKE